MDYKMNEISCKNGRNTIRGVVYLPCNTDGKIPAVILSHGYNSSYTHLADLALHLAKNGIAAYCYDFCGGSTLSISDGKTTDMSIATEQADLLWMIKYVREQKTTDPDRVFLYGESQGGFVSALTAAENKGIIAGMALLYPALCIPDNWLDKSEDELCGEFDFMGMTLSRTFYESVPKFDIYEHISAFDNPVLVMHGDSDGLVDISYAEKVKNELADCRLTVYHGEGHGFSPKARREMREEVTGFFKEVCR